MARGRRSKGKAKKPAKGRKTAKRAKSAARKPAKRAAVKSKTRKVRAKAPAKRAAAKKPRVKKPAPQPQQLEMDVVDVETIEEVAPGVAVVTDYEIVGVRPVSNEKDEEPGSQGS